MVMIELRDSAHDYAFELMDKAKEGAKKTKLALCELEDAMYECYETSKEEQEDYEPEEPEFGLRSRRGYRHDEEMRDDEDKYYDMRYRRMGGRRSGMRRNRMGRFV